MKQKWSSFNIWIKTGIILLITTLAIMTIGLILIGATGYTIPASFLNPEIYQNGFAILKNSSISDVLSQSPNTASALLGISSGTWAALQLGASLAAIVTPILFAVTLGFFGYGIYLTKFTSKNKSK